MLLPPEEVDWLGSFHYENSCLWLEIEVFLCDFEFFFYMNVTLI